MARTVNGTTQFFNTAAMNLASHHVMDLAFWLKVTAWPTTTFNQIVAYDDTGHHFLNAFGFMTGTVGGGGGATQVGVIQTDGSGHSWRDFFPQPSGNVWHHYYVRFDRSGASPVNTVWVDGTQVGFNGSFHTAGSYGFFTTVQNLWLGNDGGISPAAGTLAEVALWNGGADFVGNRWPQALAKGANPLLNHNDLGFYAPLYGQGSPEPDNGPQFDPVANVRGYKHPLTMTGVCPIVDHPPVQPIRCPQ